MGLIEERFEIVYRADFGGTLLQFVLADIAGNFDPADPKDVAMIDLVCLYEKTLIDEGVLPSDFVYSSLRGTLALVRAARVSWLPDALGSNARCSPGKTGPPSALP